MSKVIDLAAVRAAKQTETVEMPSADVPQDLEVVQQANEAKRTKLAKERAEANKGVLRSYRIKS